MSKATKKPSSGSSNNGSNSPTAQQQKAAFKEELACRIEAEHETTMYQRGVTRDDIELVLGVGDYAVYFQEFVNNFQRTRTNKLSPSEEKEPKLKVKELSKQRWRKTRRKPRGKLNQQQDRRKK